MYTVYICILYTTGRVSCQHSGETSFVLSVWGLKGNCLCVCVWGFFTYGSPNHYSCASAAHLEDYSSSKCHSFTKPLGHTFPGVDNFITGIDEDLYQIKGDEQGTHSHFCSPEAIPCPPGLRLLVPKVSRRNDAWVELVCCAGCLLCLPDSNETVISYRFIFYAHRICLYMYIYIQRSWQIQGCIDDRCVSSCLRCMLLPSDPFTFWPFHSPR